mmetsp:Transcript_8880/g.15097  ORF Transcript_8880/g.15097 Transcript_8880/m.15097 type:complete len:467 (+) Transcript_8880:77-1477(+)
MAINIPLCVAVVCFLTGYFLKVDVAQRISQHVESYQQINCTKVGAGYLHGPEDMALDVVNNILWISSYDRRLNPDNGILHPIDIITNKDVPISATFPPNFRPHGVAIAQGCEPAQDHQQPPGSTVTRLFAISHPVGIALAPKEGTTVRNRDLPHTIEVFDFFYSPTNVSAAILKHVMTSKHRYLNSPNDLIALSCIEVVVSNDLPKGDILNVLSDLIQKSRGATMVHHNIKVNSWAQLAESRTTEAVLATPPKGMKKRFEDSGITPKTTVMTTSNIPVVASFGNGLIMLPHDRSSETDTSQFPSLLLRASSADYTLLQYEFKYIDGQVKLTLQQEVSLPISPDNIEPCPWNPMEVLITGHPSVAMFLLHALPLPEAVRATAPSMVLRYNALLRNYTVLYYSSGEEMSASSVAVMIPASSPGVGMIASAGSHDQDNDTEEYNGHAGDGKLYIGQVFDPFVLVCDLHQ